MAKPKPEPRPIGLTELIHQVKRELLSPERQAGDPAPLFAVDEVELEISFTATAGLNGKIDLKVVSLGSDLSEERVQTVRVTFKPLIGGAESLAKLRTQDLLEAERIEADSLRMLKGGAEDDGSMSFPVPTGR